jgi:hypothetical protein
MYSYLHLLPSYYSEIDLDEVLPCIGEGSIGSSTWSRTHTIRVLIYKLHKYTINKHCAHFMVSRFQYHFP